MVSYSPWDHKDSDKTEPLTHTYTHTHTHSVYMSELPSQLLEKGKSKLQWGITSYQSERPSPENLQTIIAGEDVEKREPSWTVSGNVNWLQPLWKTVWGFLKKLGTNLTYDPKIPLLGMYQEKTIIWTDIRTLKLTTAQFIMQPKYPLTDGWIKKNVVHIYNGILFSHKKEWIWVSCSEVDEPRASYRVK